MYVLGPEESTEKVWLLANDVWNLAYYIKNTNCPPKTSKEHTLKKKVDGLNLYISL